MKPSYLLVALVLSAAVGCSRQGAAPIAEQPVADAAPSKGTPFGVPYTQPTAREIEQARLDWLRSEAPASSNPSGATEGNKATSGS